MLRKWEVRRFESCLGSQIEPSRSAVGRLPVSAQEGSTMLRAVARFIFGTLALSLAVAIVLPVGLLAALLYLVSIFFEDRCYYPQH